MSHPYRENLTRRRLLHGAASLAACSLLPSCGFSGSPNEGSTPANPPIAPLGSVVQGSLTVTTAPLGVIPSGFMGLSYEKLAMTYNYFHASNHNLIGLFRRLGAGVLRLGGNSADHLLWTQSGAGTHAQITPTNITDLAGFLQATGWQCLYAVNLATSTPALAAQEVGHLVSALGSNLLGIELGNEPDEYGIPGNVFAGNWTFQTFLNRWYLFRSAILQAAPHVPITGPASGGGNHISSWTVPFGQTVTPSQLTLLTQHYYRGNGASPTSTASYLVSPDPQLIAYLTTLNAGARQLGLPYRISECNSFYNGGATGVSNGYASSLWVIDFLFNVALGGSAGVNMHGGGQGPGYTPIADDSGGVIEARPEYYGLLLFALAGPGTLLQSQLSAGAIDASAYAVKSTSGALNLVVVNKDPLQTLTLAIQANQGIRTATVQSMTGASIAATSGIMIQGATVDRDGSFAPSSAATLTASENRTNCRIPALGATLISIT